MSERLVIDSRQLKDSAVNGIRVGLGVTGIVAVLVGILILARPGSALIAVGWLFGLYFIVAGVMRLITAALATDSDTVYRISSGILGLLLVAGGIYTLENPVFGATILATVIGITWIIEGVAALTGRSNDRAKWFGILYGILSIVAGVMVLFIPLSTAAILLIFAAIFLVIGGILQIIQAFLFGRHG
ncbi:HdeD family acid-resistance protein [Mycetocola saprophilus]|uniref:HdeD family acid-resistance protein n=1 Tax=Mycetocola saprophilus TaxID=76636 RepID=UPI003BF1EC48